MRVSTRLLQFIEGEECDYQAEWGAHARKLTIVIEVLSVFQRRESSECAWCNYEDT